MFFLAYVCLWTFLWYMSSLLFLPLTFMLFLSFETLLFELAEEP